MQPSESLERTTIGIDVSDKYSRVCVLDGRGAVVEEGRVATTGRPSVDASTPPRRHGSRLKLERIRRGSVSSSRRPATKCSSRIHDGSA
jgi:hypothetical protein